MGRGWHRTTQPNRGKEVGICFLALMRFNRQIA